MFQFCSFSLFGEQFSNIMLVKLHGPDVSNTTHHTTLHYNESQSKKSDPCSFRDLKTRHSIDLLFSTGVLMQTWECKNSQPQPNKGLETNNEMQDQIKAIDLGEAEESILSPMYTSTLIISRIMYSFHPRCHS